MNSPETPDTRPKRRFVAGAVCSECGEIDRITLKQAGENEWVKECVSCGHAESTEQLPAYSLPRSRKDQRDTATQPAQVVRFLDP